MAQVELEEEINLDELLKDTNKIVVYNDDINTFEHVIRTFVSVLNHQLRQAEQCAYLIHFKGKCAVKEGDENTLKPFKQALCEAYLDARIE